MTSKTKPPLDKKFYSLRVDADELEFFKLHTGIMDEMALKDHIIAIQARAYEVCMASFVRLADNIVDILSQIYGFPCIRFFSFTKYLMGNHIVCISN